MNLQELNMSWNKLGGGFITKLYEAFRKNPVQHVRQQLAHQTSESDISNSGNHDSIDNRKLQKQTSQAPDGLHALYFEGNTLLGDQGAIAIANIIRTPSDNTKRLNRINLSECGLSYTGFEELKNSLTQRANLANIANLSHVNVTIDRNNIEQPRSSTLMDMTQGEESGNQL